MSTRVSSNGCCCEWTLDGTWVILGIPLLHVWRVTSCRKGPTVVGVSLTIRSAQRQIVRAAKRLECHGIFLPEERP